MSAALVQLQRSTRARSASWRCSFQHRRHLSVAPFAQPSTPKRLLIIGGGISGLSLAHYLSTLPLPSPHRHRPVLSLIDSGDHSGGWVRTVNDSGFLFETGPRSLLARNGLSTLSLIQSLSLHSPNSPSPLLVSDSAARRRYLWDSDRRKLVLLPTGLNRSLLTFPLLRPLLQAALYEIRQPTNASGSDETIEQFVKRRFGSSAVANELFDPLVSGIYTGDIRELSLQSCFPTLHDAEASAGSIVKSLFRKREKKRSMFEDENEMENELWYQQVARNGTYSFRGGLSTLTDALHQSLTGRGVAVRLNSKIQSLSFHDSGSGSVRVMIDSGAVEEFDAIISTVSAGALSSILHRSDSDSDSDRLCRDLAEGHRALLVPTAPRTPSLSAHLSQLAQSLASLPFASVAVVNVGYHHRALPSSLTGFGFLCSRKHGQSLSLLGMSFDSSIFPQQSASDTQTRLTLMLGGARYPSVMDKTDAQIEEMALSALRSTLSINDSPAIIRVSRQRNCIPQYLVQHSQWRAGIETMIERVNAIVGGGQRLTVIGPSLYGVSVNDCVRQAKLTAHQFLGRP